MKSHATLWWSVLTALDLSRHVLANESGSFVAGNLNASAPYGIPPSEFQQVTKRLDSSATFNITGYDVSVDAAPTAAVPGWTLTVGVTTDVSLIDATNSSNLDFEATTLFIEPPGGNVTLDPSWKICAVVFPGLAAAAAASAGAASNASTSVDGTCDGMLSSECIRAIQTSSSGISDNGTCVDYALPAACSGQFTAESVNTTAIAINQTILDDSRFYAYGGPPTQTANVTAYEVAFGNIWPVITLFRHGLGTGNQTSLNTAVQCVQALNGTTTPPSDPTSGAGRYEVPAFSARYWLLFALLAVAHF